MDLADRLIAENAALAGLLGDADPSTTVPTCPGWTLDQLMRHVGRGDRWCARIVAERSGEFIEAPGGRPPADRDGRIAWLHEGVAELIAAVESSGADTPVWTFTGLRPADWWIRRRLHETAVHRADAALALGADFEIDPVVAADGISEFLGLMVSRADEEGPAGGDRPLGEGQSLHLHATDDGLGAAGEWTVLGRPDGIAADHEHIRATVALRGPARDLLLALVRRRTAAESGLAVFGDQTVWDTWLARTPF